MIQVYLDTRKGVVVIYFIKSRSMNAIKIGYTSGSAHKRLEALQTGCPDRLDLLGTMPGGMADEKATHYRFKDLHIRGEWFTSAPELTTFIADHKNLQSGYNPLIIDDDFDLEQALDDVERQYIEQALEMTDDNKQAAAKILNISYRSMRYKLEKLDKR